MRDLSAVRSLVAAVAGSGGGPRRISFSERGRVFECLVPGDSLWGAVKDTLVLAEYERAGFALSRCRGVVIDAGAHVGLFSLRASRYASRVLAIEPSRENHELLDRNVRVNRLAGTVEPLHAALWHSSGHVAFADSERSDGGVVQPQAEGGERVRAVALDELVAASSEGVDLLKLDIEGAEFPVLEAASDDTLRRVRALVVEMHLSHGDEPHRRLVKRLESLGFEVATLRPPIHAWRASASQLLRRWRLTRGVLRLKLTVLGAYTAAALLSLVVTDVRERLEPGTRLFLYATGPEQLDDGARV